MTTFLQFLEEIEQSKQTVVLPAHDVVRLVERFGKKVRGIGLLSADGAIEVPMNNITDAARSLGNRMLAEAVDQLRSPEQFADMLNSSSAPAAARLIESLYNLYLSQFQERVLRYQDSNDPSEVEHLRNEISRDLFGS